MRRVSLVLVILILSSLPVSAGPITELREQLNTVQADLTNKEQQVSSLTKREQKLAGSIIRNREIVGEYRQLANDLRQRLNQVTVELQQTKADLVAVRGEHSDYDYRYYELKDALIASMAGMQQERKRFWLGLIERFSLRSLLTEWAFSEYLIFSTGRVYAQAREDYLELSNEEAQLYEKETELTKDRARIEDELGEIQSEVSQVENEIWIVQKELNDARQKAYQLQRRLLDVRQKVRENEQQLIGVGALNFPTRGEDRLPWPLAIDGQVTSDYGWRMHPIFEDQRFHTGIDIAAPPGTEILAVVDGVVSTSESLGGYGLTVIIDHSNGLSTVYAHASKLLVPAGQRVRAGEVIALVGNTGFSTGPHLHFEVRENNDHVNPLTWL